MSAWQTRKLGELGTFRNGLNFAADARGEGLAIVGVRDFQDHSFVRFETLEQLDPRALGTPESLIRKNDILFVRSNGNRELIGRSLLVKESPPMATSHSGFTIRLRIHSPDADPSFFAYLLRGGIIRRQLSQQGGGTNINNLNQGILAALDVVCPPLEAQVRIASILGAYDDLINTNRRRAVLLDEMARGLFEEWFVRFRFPGYETVPLVNGGHEPLPQGWRSAKVGSLLLKFRRPSKVKRQDYNANGTIPCIDQGAEFIGGYTDNAGALIESPLPICVFGDHTRILKFVDFPFASGADGTQLIYPTEEITPEYMYYALLGIDLSNQHYARHFKFLKEEEIVVPMRQLAVEFTNRVKPIVDLIGKLRQQNVLLANSRDLLLPRLISGQLSVAAAERDVLVAA